MIESLQYIREDLQSYDQQASYWVRMIATHKQQLEHMSREMKTKKERLARMARRWSRIED